jgi:hypothetical protein
VKLAPSWVRVKVVIPQYRGLNPSHGVTCSCPISISERSTNHLKANLQQIDKVTFVLVLTFSCPGICH